MIIWFPKCQTKVSVSTVSEVEEKKCWPEFLKLVQDDLVQRGTARRVPWVLRMGCSLAIFSLLLAASSDGHEGLPQRHVGPLSVLGLLRCREVLKYFFDRLPNPGVAIITK